MREREGGDGRRKGGGGDTEDVFIYGKENANRLLEEWRGFRALSNSAIVKLACRRARLTRRSRESGELF